MLGYPAKHLRHPVFRTLFELLAKQGHHPVLCTNEEFVQKTVDAADIVILKTYHHDPRVIAKAREFELAGKRVINPTKAIQAITDRVRTDQMLEQAGLLVPPHVLIPSDIPLVSLPYVRKPRNNFLHQISFVDAVGDVTFDPAFYYQQVMPNDGLDWKLYVIDQIVFLVTRPADFVQNFEKKLREPRKLLPAPPAWRAWSLKIGDLTGLQVFGVDLVGRGEAFYIVDVNPFPGFVGVPDAPQYLADFLLK